jgi:hypothetical protein
MAQITRSNSIARTSFTAVVLMVCANGCCFVWLTILFTLGFSDYLTGQWQ